MATLTYNPEESQEGQLNADEQESLAVGEQLQQQQEELLAGKFKDAEDLEKAYIELQSKLGSTQKEEPQPEQQEQQQEEEATDSSILDQLWNKAINNEEVSEEFLQELGQQDPGDLARMYLEYRQQVESQPQQSQQLSDQDVSGLKGLAGGEEAYEEMIQWASNNMSEQDINLYDQVMEKGDPASCYFAVQALRMRFADSQGIDPDVITGSAPRSQFKGFRSQAELVQAMNDPRYDNDPAYRQDVMAKLEVSRDLQF